MSEYLRASFIEDFGVAEARVSTIGCGVNLREIPDIVGKDYERKEILFIGVDFYRKGGGDVLKAFRIVRQKYPSALLHLVGPRTLRIERQESDGVVFHGYLSKAVPEEKRKLFEIFHSSSVFVMPSHYEPFGIAPLEAMAHDIPCLLTNAWAFPEMVTPGENGDLVECGQVVELGEKMVEMLGSPDKLCSMGKAGRRKVLGRYTWPAVVRRLRDELASMI